MANGDMVVLGLVVPSHLIEDLSVHVPQGTTVTIPGYQTLQSKDLHQAISMKQLAVVHNSAVIGAKPDTKEKDRADKLAKENESLVTQNSALQARNNVLESQVSDLQAQLTVLTGELALVRAQESKLDAILTAVNDRPTIIQQVEGPSRSALVALPTGKVSGDVPHFIPSQIKSEGIDTDKITVKEETSTDSSVADAASKLKSLRKKQ